MTEMQLENKKLQETKRANLEKESENRKERKEKTKREWIKGGLRAGSSALGSVLGAINDPSWYNYNKQSVDDVARFSFGTPLAQARGDTVFTLNNGTQTGVANATPGIMGIQFIPTIGAQSQSASDGVNVAAKNIYSYVRYANSGSRNYDAPDLMMYLLCMDQAIIAYSYLCKVYSVIRDAKSQNWYYPQGFIENMSIGSDIVSDPARLRSLINRFAIRMNSFNVPGNLPIYARHAWLTLNIFKDHDIKRSQLYHFVPLAIGYWDPTVEMGSHINMQNITGYNIASSFATCEAAINYIVSNMINDSDIGIMSGDILKAYGEQQMYRFTEIPDDFHVEETFSMEVLSQINSATLNGDDNLISCDINQTSNGIIYQGDALVTGHPGINVHVNPTNATTVWVTPENSERLVNIYKDGPTPDDVMVATRLTTTWKHYSDQSGSGANYRYVTRHGTEVCVGARITYFNVNNNTYSHYTLCDYQPELFQTSFLEKVEIVKSFDWAPRIRLQVSSNNTSPYAFLAYDNMDNANFVVLNEDNLRAVHDVATLSEYAVPVFKKEPAKPYSGR